MTATNNRNLYRFFYAAGTDYYYVCNYCGTKRKQLPSSGYANLMSHLKDNIPTTGNNSLPTTTDRLVRCLRMVA
ncbi:hypothetical protein PHMEG_00029649 [Phytophthora megakarya]|uniref:BED-type domain-containing protein n=1 Tax=Phytophthora megakarya TaxID=4795 RepID=A0A225V0L1_9STRA|nr:hypothetical protein PHMEG_00029649 [Phytophthora megakarya]